MGLAPYGERSKYYDKLREFVKIDPEGDEPYAILVNGKKVKTKDWAEWDSIYSYVAENVIGGKSLNWNPRGELKQGRRERRLGGAEGDRGGHACNSQVGQGPHR